MNMNCNVLSPHGVLVPSQCGPSLETVTSGLRDPNCVKRKGAPKKFRKKSPLESNSKKGKGRSRTSNPNRSKSQPSNVGVEADDVQIFRQRRISTHAHRTEMEEAIDFLSSTHRTLK
ncbi:Hypothetical predicted protein [Olea europaea subsp. europaea]|uniref:Uncharacterized protein n=1 Tax=Olea europaea subsp. europaea TaxID=158383 RepID=A0A8S0QUU0_OLEEU|nr:Hypothetical predicted protein [Olea europaea subsp. europaea]